MPEHRIRLRGGWDCHYREGPDEDAPEVLRRVDLPADSAADLPARFRLARQFGRPPVDPRREEVVLELRHVEGLKSARLNGRPIAPASADGRDWSVALTDPLPPRNGLVLDVERDESPASSGPWGEISLVIRPR